MLRKPFLIAFAFVLQLTCAFAQPGGGPGGGGDPGHGQPVPITGIELLLVAGGILGARKMLKSDRNKSE